MTQDGRKSTRMLVGPCLSVVLAALGISITAVTLPDVSREFSSANSDVALIVAVYVLATTALIVPVGRAGDLYGKRLVLLIGLVLYLLGAIFSAAAAGLTSLTLARLVQGVGAAAMLAMPMAQVRDVVSNTHVGRWMGVIGTMSAIGTASGPALGGLLTASFGWRAVYLAQIPFTAIALILCFWLLSDEKRVETARQINLASAVLLAACLGALSFAISSAYEGFDTNLALYLTVAIFAGVAFFAAEARATAPILPLGLMDARHLQLSLLLNALVSLVMMGMLVVGPFYLTGGLGLTTAQMGLAMSIGPISAALSGIPAGRLIEKIGTHQGVVLGAVAVMVGTGAMSALPYFWGISGFGVAFMMLAPGYQIFLAALNTSVIAATVPENRGVMSGLLNLSRNFGFIIGTSVVSGVFWALADWRTGVVNDALSVQQAMAGTFLIACGLTALVVFLAVVTRRLSVKPEIEPS